MQLVVDGTLILISLLYLLFISCFLFILAGWFIYLLYSKQVRKFFARNFGKGIDKKGKW